MIADIFEDPIMDALGDGIFGRPDNVRRGPKPEGDGWYKCECDCHAATKMGIKVWHARPCCTFGWKQFTRLTKTTETK